MRVGARWAVAHDEEDRLLKVRCAQPAVARHVKVRERAREAVRERVHLVPDTVTITTRQQRPAVK